MANKGINNEVDNTLRLPEDSIDISLVAGFHVLIVVGWLLLCGGKDDAGLWTPFESTTDGWMLVFEMADVAVAIALGFEDGRGA